MLIECFTSFSDSTGEYSFMWLGFDCVILYTSCHNTFNVAKLCNYFFFQERAFAEFTAEDCWVLGFNKANLLCSSCEQLPKFDLEILKYGALLFYFLVFFIFFVSFKGSL